MPLIQSDACFRIEIFDLLESIDETAKANGPLWIQIFKNALRLRDSGKTSPTDQVLSLPRLIVVDPD